MKAKLKEKKNKLVEDSATPSKDSIATPQIEKADSRQILDRLNIQLLISVIIYFVGAWAFLNGRICSFTGFEPLGEQMSYILVHYVLTVTLLLCVCLTAIKSYFILKTESSIKEWLIKLLKFFLETWYLILGLCFIIILCSGLFMYEWLFGAVVLLFLLSFKMRDNGFKYKYIIGIIIVLVVLFPVFISSMTAIVKNVDIKSDKPFYSFSEKVYITVSSRGYACNHKLVGLGENYKGVKYYNDKGLIVLNATQINNNEIAIATITPVTGLSNFISYPYCKMFGKDFSFMSILPNDVESIKKYANFTPYSIYVKP